MIELIYYFEEEIDLKKVDELWYKLESMSKSVNIKMDDSGMQMKVRLLMEASDLAVIECIENTAKEWGIAIWSAKELKDIEEEARKELKKVLGRVWYKDI